MRHEHANAKRQRWMEREKATVAGNRREFSNTCLKQLQVGLNKYSNILPDLFDRTLEILRLYKNETKYR